MTNYQEDSEELDLECYDPSDPIEWDDMNMPTFLLGGCMISVSCDLFLYPFELIKTRLQVQGLRNTSFESYSGVRHAIRSVFVKEGFRGLYKGFGFTMLGYIPSELIYYSTYEFNKRFLKTEYSKLYRFSKETLPTLETVEPAIYLLCGGLSELCSATIWIPCDIIQQRLMTQGPISSKRLYNGGIDALTKTLRDDGIRGFYRGSLATCLTFSCQSAINWMVYEQVRRSLFRYHKKRKRELTATTRTISHMMCGAVSGTAAALAATPFDVIKTRLQVQQYHSKTGIDVPKAKTIRTMFRSIVQHDGYSGLMRGATARVLYHAPVTSITLVMYETIKRFALKEDHPGR